MRRFLHILLTAALLVAALGATACAELPGARQARQFLGLERPFPHNDVPPPPSPGAYALQFGMGQTQRIVVRAGAGGAPFEITDPQAIGAVLAVLRAGPHASAPPGAAIPQAPLRLDFIAGPPERTVTAHFSPGASTLQLYNTPTPAWPDHAVGVYPLTPAFGAALLDALTQ